MTTLELHGRINEAGKLEVELPEGLPVGDVKVVIEVPSRETSPDNLYELWADLGIDLSEKEIDEARREAWANFPREDIA